MKGKAGQPFADAGRGQRLPGPKNRRGHKGANRQRGCEVNEDFPEGGKFAVAGHSEAQSIANTRGKQAFKPRAEDAGRPRQGRADYRCCIPALAGFVSRTSTAPGAKDTVAVLPADTKRIVGEPLSSKQKWGRGQTSCFARWVLL